MENNDDKIPVVFFGLNKRQTDEYIEGIKQANEEVLSGLKARLKQSVDEKNKLLTEISDLEAQKESLNRLDNDFIEFAHKRVDKTMGVIKRSTDEEISELNEWIKQKLMEHDKRILRTENEINLTREEIKKYLEKILSELDILKEEEEENKESIKPIAKLLQELKENEQEVLRDLKKAVGQTSAAGYAAAFDKNDQKENPGGEYRPIPDEDKDTPEVKKQDTRSKVIEFRQDARKEVKSFQKPPEGKVTGNGGKSAVRIQTPASDSFWGMDSISPFNKLPAKRPGSTGYLVKTAINTTQPAREVPVEVKAPPTEEAKHNEIIKLNDEKAASCSDQVKNDDAKPVHEAAKPVSSNEIELIRYKYIVGKITGEDLFDGSGRLIAAKNSVITNEIILAAEKEGKLSELIVNMIIPGLG